MAFNLMTTKNQFTAPEYIVGRNHNKGNCSVSRNTTENFFYSNNPERVDENRLADAGVWLAKEYITGSGHLYTWHINGTQLSKTIHSDILLYNPNSTPVTITFTNIGLTNGYGSDRNAWINYYNNSSGSKSYVLQSEQFLSPDILKSLVSPGRVFGKIARFSISGPGLYIYDLAYENNSGGALNPAPKDIDSKSPTRGLGKGFYETMDVKLTLTDNAATQSFSLGGHIGAEKDPDDSFYGADLIPITDSSKTNNASYELYGNYGVQMRINLTIDNQCRNGNNGKRVRIFMGSWSGKLVPFCRYNKQFYSAVTGTIDSKNYIDVLYNDAMPTGSSTVIFDMVVPATSSAPVIVGARWV